VLLVEGAGNLIALVLKAAIGLEMGSIAILADAVHSLTDVANNCVAWIVTRLSTRPADEGHPYGHRKFETLAVFVLAMVLTTTALGLGMRALRGGGSEILQSGWALVGMLCVLAVNTGLAAWEGMWARRLESDILRADARHTFADVLTTIVVIGGWQAAARGYPWLDSLAALGVSGLILFLAYGLFRRSIPILVDHASVQPERLVEAALTVPGVIEVRSVRSRSYGIEAAADLVVVVAGHLDTVQSHEVATAVERVVQERLPVETVTVHVEPAASAGSPTETS
jgi:cation diffusion facilitator family transporter